MKSRHFSLAFIHLPTAIELKISKSSKTWTKIRYQYLYRHSGGIYYARLTVNGRKTLGRLKIKIMEVERAELNILQEEEKKRSGLATPATRSVTCPVQQMAAEKLELALSEIHPKRPRIDSIHQCQKILQKGAFSHNTASWIMSPLL